MSIPRATKKLVLERDNGLCVIDGPFCFGSASVVDHRANRGMGGSSMLDSPENLIAACPQCNGLKEDATGVYLEMLIRRGVRLLKRGQPALQVLERARAMPVEYPGGQWWSLDEFGSRKPATHVP